MAREDDAEIPKLSSTPSVANKGKKKSKKRRRRVSKHILDSVADTTTTAADTKEEGSTPKQAKTETAAKDKALEYLERWKNDTTSWKFNKKLQTWLIRNMYDASLVPKHSFEVLISYSLPNASLRARISKEATERAVRYQQHLEGKVLAASGYDALSQHDKRKEYKRARKMLEALDDYQA